MKSPEHDRADRGPGHPLAIFLQRLLGHTASFSGWILSPGGVAVLVMMPVVAMLLKHVDTRWLIGTAFIIGGTGLFLMAGFNLQVAFRKAMATRMIQSLGLAFLFMPMNVTAFHNVPPRETAYATSLLNLVRNVGGSTGIALVTTILSRRAQFHQANLVGNLQAGNPAFTTMLNGARQLLVSRGTSMAAAGHMRRA